MENIVIVAGFWGMYIFILFAMWILKEQMAWQPTAYSMLDFYPFLCRKCLTTWTLIASYISVGIIISSPLFAVFGVLLGAGTGYAMDYTEKERTIE